ncbi:two pore domain potassium channel family protein [Mycolicibacterium sp. GF69]|nr:two pore domain potassium channel family protein [Mycolicibacterium sp. GF69]
MNWLTTVLGAALIIVLLRDIFHTLLHPSGRGRISQQVMKLVWRFTGPTHRPRLASLTGPLGMLAVISTWGVAAVVAWMLVYIGQMPDGVSYSGSLNPTDRSRLLDSLYLSLVTVTTLGYGDIAPTSPWLKVAAPLEALVGFLLLTAAVSWVLQVYPALERRRSLALQLNTLRQARRSLVPSAEANISHDLITTLAAGLARTRIDLNQYAATYYFHDSDSDSSLAAALPYACKLADVAARSSEPHTQLAAAMLVAALDRFARVLDDQFLHNRGDTNEIIGAYAADHAVPDRHMH